MDKTLFNIGMGNDVSLLLKNSKRPVSGLLEREIVIPNNKVMSTKKKLLSAGYIIVGTGNAGFNRTKIWFNPRGMPL